MRTGLQAVRGQSVQPTLGRFVGRQEDVVGLHPGLLMQSRSRKRAEIPTNFIVGTVI